MSDRARRYASQKAKSRSPALIIAHVHRTAKGKIRLGSVQIVLPGGKEEVVAENLPKNDPGLAFEDQYDVRKSAHEIVKKSGRFSKFYDSIVKLVYDE